MGDFNKAIEMTSGIKLNSSMETRESLISNCSLPFYYIVKQIVDENPCLSKPGGIGSISFEAVLFSTNPSMAFPKRDVEYIKENDKAKSHLPPIEVVINFSGLYGSTSPLPDFYSESIAHSEEEVSASGKLLDIFSHRLISLLYRSWEMSRYIDQYQQGARDSYSNNLFSLFGMRGEEIRNDSVLDWKRLIPFALYFRNGIASKRALVRLVSYYFSISAVKVIPFERNEIRISKSDYNRLGTKNSTLEKNLTVGTSITQFNKCFSVCLGPISYRIFRSFLPGSKNLCALRSLVARITKRPLILQVELIVESADIPSLVLANAEIFQLGYNTWLGKPADPQFNLTI